jgi:hypothetical protein
MSTQSISPGLKQTNHKTNSSFEFIAKIQSAPDPCDKEGVGGGGVAYTSSLQVKLIFI